MNVTSIIETETPKQINADSIVYAWETATGSSILLSKGGVIVDVTDTVAELITESAGSLTAFTAVSGDATGDIAVNPNYILTVDSANSGTYSLLTLCDNVSPRARITVDTAYADMDAIIEVAAGGAASYSVYTALLSQSGTNDPVATVLQNTLGGTVVWSRNTTGDFSATLGGAFTTNKTTVLSSINYDQSAGYHIFYETPSEDEVKLYQKNNSSVSADQLGCTVEIRVYP